MLVADQLVVQPDAQRAAGPARGLLQKREYPHPAAMVARVRPGTRHVKDDVIAQQPRDRLHVSRRKRVVVAANDAPPSIARGSSARPCVAMIWPSPKLEAYFGA